MSLSNTAENAILLWLFNNTTWANVGDATGLVGSAVAGSLYVSLHTADPGEAGNQTTSETSYTSYVRVAVARSGVGWTVTGDSVSPAAAITFATCTGGTASITHVGVGSASSGAGILIAKGALDTPISVSATIAPIVKTSSTLTLA